MIHFLYAADDYRNGKEMEMLKQCTQMCADMRIPYVCLRTRASRIRVVSAQIVHTRELSTRKRHARMGTFYAVS